MTGWGDIFNSDFFRALLMFLATYFGAKHGTSSGGDSGKGG